MFDFVQFWLYFHFSVFRHNMATRSDARHENTENTQVLYLNLLTVEHLFEI